MGDPKIIFSFNRFLKNSLRGVFQGRFSKQSFENLAFSSTIEAVNKSRKMAVHPCTANRLLFQEPVKAVSSVLPHSFEAICFDRFHVAQYFGKAVDKVRAQEHRALLLKTGKSVLKGTKFKWLANSSRIDNRSRRNFMALTRMTLKTAHAWMIKELASGLWDFGYRGSAEKAWVILLRRISRCRLEPVIKVGRMVKHYLWGILNAIIAGVSNAVAEAKNGRIQWIKKMACGFRNKERFKMAILFHLGGLDLMPKALKSQS
jgi:transposase